MIQTTIATIAVTINSRWRQRPTESDRIQRVVITSAYALVANAAAIVPLKEG